jgi:hypothetical protein
MQQKEFEASKMSEKDYRSIHFAPLTQLGFDEEPLPNLMFRRQDHYVMSRPVMAGSLKELAQFTMAGWCRLDHISANIAAYFFGVIPQSRITRHC